ncbi:MAG: terpene cyclase/mutase family protein [Planctomycetes bacterium]|nr:terpene cyclase/mutase family protein [Planctomycetota bacterium]
MRHPTDDFAKTPAGVAWRLAGHGPGRPYRWLLCAACATLLLISTPVVVGEGQPDGAANAGELPAEGLSGGVAGGLQWLAAQQQADGSFGSLSHYGPHVGITGLAGLAFMAEGSSPGRGSYGDHIEKCVRFVVDHSSESGLLAAETSHGPMYGHGFATLFLAETYGMSADPDLGEALRKAVRLIVATQNEEGGWRYQPMRQDADISVTVCQIMALRAARNAGIHVAKSVIDRAADYVKASQNPDGGFRYMLSPGASAFARSAAGVAALQYAGIYRSDEIRRGLDYLVRFRPPTEQSVSHYFYGHYYAVQAMFVSGGGRWQQWWPAIRTELLGRQHEDGYWKGQAGPEYGTAMALIVLQIPQGLLPIFQK